MIIMKTSNFNDMPLPGDHHLGDQPGTDRSLLPHRRPGARAFSFLLLSELSAQVLGMGDFGKVLMQLGWYFTTVILGLFIHGLIVLPILYSVVTRTLPFK